MNVKAATVNKNEGNKKILAGVLRGSLFAVAVSLIGILIFAFIIKLTNINDNFIGPVNQAIKGISVLMGCFYASKQASTNGLIKGILIGITYTILSFLIFSVLSSQIQLTKTLVNDILFGGIIGAICGVIAINFKE